MKKLIKIKTLMCVAFVSIILLLNIPIAAARDLGKQPGHVQYSAYSGEIIDLYINAASRAGAIPAHEWLFFYVKGDDPIVWLLINDGVIQLTGDTDLRESTYNFTSAVSYLATVRLSDFGITTIAGALIYGYAYSVGDLSDIIIENVVTIYDP